MRTSWWLGVGVAVLVLANEARPQPKPAAGKSRPDPVFQRSVLPILTTNCIGCHNDKKMKGGIDLTSVDKIIHGGNTGAGLVPGNSGESLLLRLILADGKPHMPPKKQLTPQDVKTITKWIDGIKEAPPEMAAEKPEKPQKPETTDKPEKPAPAETKPASDPEQLAAIKLNLAKRFEKDGLLASARTRYRDIIKTYPDTKAAAEAKQRLKALK